MPDMKEKVLRLMTYPHELSLYLEREEDRFKWFLISVLFAKRISSEVAKRTYREFEKAGIITPESIIEAKGAGSIMRYLMAVGLLLLLAFSACTQPGGAQKDEDEVIFNRDRVAMVDVQIVQRGIHDARVIAAMSKVPRHRFVPDDYLSQAYEDHPLPIGNGQTISQPYIVALMTEHLALRFGEKVLEIGTGSGYQAAILAELTNQVYTVEIIEPLGQQAATTLEELGYNVRCKIDDGYYGWPEHAPFDTIIVTCAPDHVPQPLLRQLKDGGRMVIPIGPPGFLQTLWLIEKKGGKLQSTNLGGVTFVPLLGEQ